MEHLPSTHWLTLARGAQRKQYIDLAAKAGRSCRSSQRISPDSLPTIGEPSTHRHSFCMSRAQYAAWLHVLDAAWQRVGAFARASAGVQVAFG